MIDTRHDRTDWDPAGPRRSAPSTDRPVRLDLSEPKRLTMVRRIARSQAIWHACIRAGWAQDDLDSELLTRVIARQSMASRYDPARSSVSKYLTVLCRSILLNLYQSAVARNGTPVDLPRGLDEVADLHREPDEVHVPRRSSNGDILSPVLPSWFGRAPTAAELSEARSIGRRAGAVLAGFLLGLAVVYETADPALQAALSDHTCYTRRHLQRAVVVLREIRLWQAEHGHPPHVMPPHPTMAALSAWAAVRAEDRARQQREDEHESDERPQVRPPPSSEPEATRTPTRSSARSTVRGHWLALLDALQRAAREPGGQVWVAGQVEAMVAELNALRMAA